jgi:3-dehydrosphinganine reductase
VKDFEDTVIYITGGASGIGLETGRQLAALGAHIAILDFNPTDASLQSIEAARRSPQQRVTRYQLDIVDRQRVIAVVAQAASEFGPPDIVINSAGIAIAGEFTDLAIESFDRVMQVNLYGSRHICEAVVPFMRKRGSGQIVLVASMGGYVAIYGYTNYSTSKFAVRGFAEALHYELKPLGINVQCLCPGEVATPMVANEHETMHPATWAQKKLGGTISVETAVRDLIKGLRRGNPVIVTGGMSKAAFWINRLLPPRWWFAFNDATIAQALRNMKEPQAARGG